MSNIEMLNDKELLELIRKEYYRIQPKGFVEFFKKRDKRIPCYPSLKKRFNNVTYNRILELAGIKREELNFFRSTDEEYIDKVNYLCKKLGRIPTCKELKENNICCNVLVKRFSSVQKFFDEFETEYTMRKNTKVPDGKELLLKKYIEFSNKLGHPASTDELNYSKEIYNAGVFAIRFNGISGLKKAAGYDYIDKNKKWSKDKIHNLLISKRQEKGKRLVLSDLKGEISIQTVDKYYETTKIREVFDLIEKEIISRKEN